MSESNQKSGSEESGRRQNVSMPPDVGVIWTAYESGPGAATAQGKPLVQEQ